MNTLPLKRRLFLQPPGGKLTPTDLEIEGPLRFFGHPGRPLAADHFPIYQAIARCPGLLDAEGAACRSDSTLEALIGALTSVRQRWRDFDKDGGRIYGAMSDDENAPDLSVQIKAKDFLS